MRRATAVLVLVASLAGCTLLGEPVEVLTGAMPFDADECSTDFYVSSMLLADPEYGTVVAGFLADQRTPVMWPPGFTGRRVGSEVAVLDATGIVVATTGQSFSIRGNMLFQFSEGELSTYRRGVVLSPIGEDVLYACGQVRPDPTSHLLDVLPTVSP